MINYDNIDSADQRLTVDTHESAEDVNTHEADPLVSYYDEARKDIKAVIFLGKLPFGSRSTIFRAHATNALVSRKNRNPSPRPQL
jgi:hypothetical protein